MRRILGGVSALVLILTVVLFPAGASLSGITARLTGTSSASSPLFRAYRAMAAQPNELVKADKPVADLAAQAKQQRNDAVTALLTAQKQAGAVQSFAYDSASD